MKNIFKDIKFSIPLMFVFSVFLLLGCENKQKQQEEDLANQARAIIADCEASSASTIENTIASIKSFLSKYPESEKYSELINYVDQLYVCLDSYKVKEANEHLEKFKKYKYYNTKSAIEEMNSFINDFSSTYGSELLMRRPELKSIIEEVKNIKKEFESMETFFRREYPDLESYNYCINNTSQYNFSDYESVRNSWKEISNTHRGQQADNDLNKKSANFEQYLIEDAKKICQNNYDDFVVTDIQTVSIGTPYKDDQYKARICEGVFRVSMKGAYLGWDKGSVKIRIKGRIGVIVDEKQIASHVEYRNADYDVIERVGDVK